MYKNVTLVNSPYYIRRPGIFEYVEGYTIPLGIMSLAAVIQRDLPDVQINIVDGQAEMLSPHNLIDRIIKTNPELVGISSFTYDINDTLLLSKTLKTINPELKIILGGVFVTHLPEEIIKDENVDFIIRGEGEYSFRDLISNKELESIKGLVYKDSTGVVKLHPEKAVVEDIDDLPMLAYSLIDMKRYFPTAGQCHRFPVGTMITSRGCPGNCIFCSSSVTGKKTRYRSAENVVKDMKFLMNNYGVREIIFMDDTFTSNKKRVLEFCQIIEREKLDILWDCSTRVQFVDKNLLQTMKRSGCSQISFGVESGDENVLKDIKKSQKLEDVRQKVTIAKEVGLETRCSFIIGFPTDTLESIQRTIDFAIELDPHLVSFYIACPFPGTEMYNWAVKNNMLLTKDWSYYDQCHHIMKIPNVTFEQIDKMYQRAYKSFYYRPKYLLKRLMMLKSLYDIKNAIKAIRMTSSFNVPAFMKVEHEIEASVDNQYKEAIKCYNRVLIKR